VSWVLGNLVLVQTVLVSVHDRCTVCAKCTKGLKKSFWMHMMELLGDVGHVESRFGPFRDSVRVVVR
jgi:hypothetical protein